MTIKSKLTGVLAVGLAAALVVGVFALRLTHQAAPAHLRDQPLRVSVIPSAEKGELQTLYAPLLARLAQNTGRKAEMVPASSYEDLLQLFKAHRVDLAFLGGLTFIQAHAFYGAEPLVMRDAAKRASTYAVVKEGGPFQDCYNLACANLKQARLLFGPPLSTSAHLMPRHFLKVEHRIDPETYFSAVSYAPGHREVTRAVAQGEADLGMVNAEMFRNMLRDGIVKPGELLVIWETPPFSDAVWAVPGDMDEATKTQLRDTFLALAPSPNTASSDASPDLFDNYLPAGMSDFATLEEIAQSQGLLGQGAP